MLLGFWGMILGVFFSSAFGQTSVYHQYNLENELHEKATVGVYLPLGNQIHPENIPRVFLKTNSPHFEELCVEMRAPTLIDGKQYEGFKDVKIELLNIEAQSVSDFKVRISQSLNPNAQSTLVTLGHPKFFYTGYPSITTSNRPGLLPVMKALKYKVPVTTGDLSIYFLINDAPLKQNVKLFLGNPAVAHHELSVLTYQNLTKTPKNPWFKWYVTSNEEQKFVIELKGSRITVDEVHAFENNEVYRLQGTTRKSFVVSPELVFLDIDYIAKKTNALMTQGKLSDKNVHEQRALLDETYEMTIKDQNKIKTLLKNAKDKGLISSEKYTELLKEIELKPSGMTLKEFSEFISRVRK